MRLCIATFNLENLDDKSDDKPTLEECIEIMRPQLQRADADIFAFRKSTARKKQASHATFWFWK